MLKVINLNTDGQHLSYLVSVLGSVPRFSYAHLIPMILHSSANKPVKQWNHHEPVFYTYMHLQVFKTIMFYNNSENTILPVIRSQTQSNPSCDPEPAVPFCH